MKFTVVPGSDGTMYMPSFLKIGFDVQNMLRCGNKHRDRDTQATKAISNA
jgi:hypothetical protein